jgi:FkbM family methyltransferase
MDMTDSMLGVLIPVCRSYMRYVPFGIGKERAWSRFIRPRLAWRSHPFVAKTVFDATIHGNQADIVQKYIYYFGIWEPALTAFMQERFRPGDGFIDVGANVGYFSLLASRLVGGSGKVVAIEASPVTFDKLRAHLDENGAANVRAVNVAVADRDGRVPIYQGPLHNSGTTTIVEHLAQSTGCQFVAEVDARPLSTIVTDEEWGCARIVKIDVEGFEWNVVQGMTDLLRRGRTDLEIVMEVSPSGLDSLGKTPADLLAIFAAAGFNPYVLDNLTSGRACLSPGPVARPTRLRTPITSQTDLILSRIDADVL